jgi:hypothetical protein
MSSSLEDAAMKLFTRNKSEQNDGRDYFWIWEVLVFVTVTPALVYAVSSLQNLPVA